MVAPLLKWPGGKTRELSAIRAALPDDLGRIVDPFVGGGALLFDLPPAVPAVVNDASTDLVDLYVRVQRADPVLFARLDGLAAWWDRELTAIGEGAVAPLVAAFLGEGGADPDVVREVARQRLGAVADAIAATVPAEWPELVPTVVADVERLVPDKLARMRAGERRRERRLCEPDVWRNVEGAVRAAVYTRLRTDYNAARACGAADGAQTARFLFLREYCYAAMFRFNRRGGFNVPYGGITYNRKPLSTRVAHLRSAGVRARLATTTVTCADFADFLDRAALRPDDVVFLDPPYDSDFSDYDGNGFGRADHERLAAAIRSLPCRFQLVIRDTPFVRALYANPAWHVVAFGLTYAWTIKERNDRRATHLLITDVDAPRPGRPPLGAPRHASGAPCPRCGSGRTSQAPKRCSCQGSALSW